MPTIEWITKDAGRVRSSQLIIHKEHWLAAIAELLGAPPSRRERQLTHGTITHRYNFGGSMRSYWDMYFGYGVEAAFIGLVEAVLFWQLVNTGAASPGAARPIIALFLVANVGHAILARYFFLAPLVPDAVIALLLAWAGGLRHFPVTH